MSNNIIVKKAGSKGKGVFALKDFRKNEIITHVNGKVIETDNPSSLPRDFQDHCFPFNKKGNKHSYVAPKSPWKYINHSCEPNIGIKNNRDFVAMKAIKKGQEICFDYAMNNIDRWTMKCNCGSKNCRKIISNFSALDDKTKNKYLDYTIDYIKEKYS